MEPHQSADTSLPFSPRCWRNLNLPRARCFILAYQSLGVVYGDLSTSPLYVYTSTFAGKLQHHQTEEALFGAFSLIFWTLTFIPLLKYVIIVLGADDNGEGGTFALYSLLCRHATFNLLPNQHPADEQLSTYKYGPSTTFMASSPLKRFLEKHNKLRTALFIVVLFGASMVIGDGVLTPSISVLSAISGLRISDKTGSTNEKLSDGVVLLISCAMLVGLFALQHYGTHKVAFLFAPIVVIWLISIFAIGLYNTIYWNPSILRAISPYYIVKFFRRTGKDGWISLGGVVLSITGTEALFADLGHFTALSIRLAFAFVVYPCLVLQYMGQAAFLSKNPSSIPTSFYDSIPDPLFWPIFVIAALAAIVGSQAIITATFSIIKQCHSLGCFPRVKVVHTSSDIYGQIYIPEINWILMVLCLAITIGFHSTTLIGNAYGIACMTVMFITTWLMALVIVFVRQKSILLALVFLLFFWFIEGVYISASLTKFPQGGWVPIALSVVVMLIMYVWHYGFCNKYNFDMQNKVSLRWLLDLGASLGIVRVPGIGLIYSEVATGVPAIFSHFVTNLPAFHQVLVFVCVKSVPVPYVPREERFLIGRVGPRSYRMYRCIIRYGYKDICGDNCDFESQLIQSIAEFIQLEADDPECSSESWSSDGRMAVIGARAVQSSSSLMVIEQDESIAAITTVENLHSADDYEDVEIGMRRRVRFQVAERSGMDDCVRDELMELIEAKEAGVAYIMGHSRVKARRSSSLLKKVAIDVAYSFLRKSCRGPALALNIPHVSLVEVGMIYYV
ncbi:hypothetical protein Scep_020830 [Stephania cephalantha]|uniref:Potassium transporter n=1 Tax=Stephania cephalantha TaxID=152367 RepID=A0AAP0F291_9MAGN